MSGATVLACKCYHTVQDKLHGQGMRAHNYSPKAFNAAGGWRCTVCLDLKARRYALPKPTVEE
jgi:hypothetical protein